MTLQTSNVNLKSSGAVAELATQSRKLIYRFESGSPPTKTTEGITMRRLIAMLAVLALTACATVDPGPYRPIVDTKGVDLAKYEGDLAECSALADQAHPVKQAAGGALAGAVVGGALGALIGGRGGAALGAKVGAGEGLIGGAAGGVIMQHAAVKMCLIGRGYRVLA